MKRAFVFGTPRSGTTWVQLLLAQHPQVATAQETHLFDRYLVGLWEGWRWDNEERAEREVGISDLVTEEEFLDLCRGFSEIVLDRIARRVEGAELVVEKTPGHARCLGLVRILYPEAHLVHVLRDPRAVTASLLRANRSWASGWAPTGPTACAEFWREHVVPALEHCRSDPRCHLVRYEELAADTPNVLERLFRRLELNVDRAFCREAADACRIDRLEEDADEAEAPWDLGEEPEGFFGPGEPEGWREELSVRTIKAVEYELSSLMAELGYYPVSNIGRRPLRSWLRAGLGRLHRGLEWRIRHLMRKL